MSPNPPDDVIRKLLAEARTMAVVGASANPARPSHGVMSRLMRAGYRCFPVNPNEPEVLGQRAYASLADVPDKIDVVDVFRRSEFVPPVVDEAIRIGAKVLWLQEGVVHEEAAAKARAAGLVVVQDLCTAVMISLLRVAPGA